MANNTGDLFGIKDESPPAEAVTGETTKDGPAPYTILQMISAEGWRAVFVTQDPQRQRLLSLACFALVETVETTETGIVRARSVRPIVVEEDGETDDVAAFDDFLCLIPPQNDPTIPAKLKPVIEAALARRSQVSQRLDAPQ